jgi:hypothetical protein
MFETRENIIISFPRSCFIKVYTSSNHDQKRRVMIQKVLVLWISTFAIQTVAETYTSGTYPVLNDTNIQTLLLTDGTAFVNISFDFSVNTTYLVTDDSDKDNSTKPDQNTTSDGARFVYDSFVVAIVFVLTVHAMSCSRAMEFEKLLYIIN